MATYKLTTGTDTVVGTSADDTVDGTAATLNPSDSLDGGGGYNTLALFGSGTFDLSALAQFVNFQEVDVTNITGGQSNLTLPNGIGLTVNVDNESGNGGTINLADSAVTLNLGSSGNYTVNGSTGTATISGSNGGHFHLSGGDETINLTGGNNGTFYLSTGAANITSSGVYLNDVYVSSGKSTIDFSNSSYNYIIVQDVSTINYNDIFTGYNSNENYLYVDGSGQSNHGALHGRWSRFRRYWHGDLHRWQWENRSGQHQRQSDQLHGKSLLACRRGDHIELVDQPRPSGEHLHGRCRQQRVARYHTAKTPKYNAS
jgi:hypothetical protein